jgi:hypothetical protein
MLQVKESSFMRYLVDTPLVPKQARDAAGQPSPLALGSFHQQYYIDGELSSQRLCSCMDILSPPTLPAVLLFVNPVVLLHHASPVASY